MPGMNRAGCGSRLFAPGGASCAGRFEFAVSVSRSKR
jgi:hypothetical protein